MNFNFRLFDKIYSIYFVKSQSNSDRCQHTIIPPRLITPTLTPLLSFVNSDPKMRESDFSRIQFYRNYGKIKTEVKTMKITLTRKTSAWGALRYFTFYKNGVHQGKLLLMYLLKLRLILEMF